MATDSDRVLVTGATGKQGGAVTRALVAADVPVRALVRDPGSARARAVAALGVELVAGDLLDRDSLRPALEGVRGVFSVQMPDRQDPTSDSEVVQGTNLVEAARAAGVRQFVHTSVSGAGQHRDAPGWAEGRWAALEHYYESKDALQVAVRSAGFEQWTILKPGFFMENLLPPSFVFPHGIAAGPVTVIKPAAVLALVAVDDIGAAGAAALRSPDAFDRVELELASERCTLAELVAVLAEALGREIPVSTLDDPATAGMPEWARAHEWHNVVGQPADPAQARALGVPLTSLRTWVSAHLPQLAGAG